MKSLDTIRERGAFEGPVYLELYRQLGLGEKGTVLFTAPSGGEGVSTVCLEFALFAGLRAGRRTLLVDGHLVRPALSQVFRAQARGPGLRGLFLGATADGDSVSATEIPGVYFLHAGVEGRPGPLPVVERDAVGALLSRLRGSFDLVVIDAPPVSATSDALVLGSSVDACVLVVEAERTRREAAQAALDRLGEAGAPVAGAFLNKQRFHIPAPIYRRI